jgi:hypothetical protein
MLDTTVYVDALKRPLPAEIASVLTRTIVFHCAIACAELAISIGHLDPWDPRTIATRGPLEETFTRMASASIVAPSADAWTEASLMAGILARTQGFERAQRQKLLHDALMFLTANEIGATSISRNVRDMDLLLHLKPSANVLLYELPQRTL